MWIIEGILNKISIKIKKCVYNGFKKNVLKTNFKKNVLMVYILDPFILNSSNSHSNQKQVIEIAKIFSSFGYNVDVLDSLSYKKVKYKYDLIFLVDCNLLPKFYNNMKCRCKIIGYLTGSDLVFSNEAEEKRLNYLYDRHKVHLKARRRATNVYDKFLMENKIDAFFLMGNKFTLSTYDRFNIKPVFFIKNSANILEIRREITFKNKKQKSFLFLASYGQVLKGLDIVLDVFSKTPDLKLYVCSNFEQEKDFCKLYNKILFNSENVKAIGFIDVNSKVFENIIDECSYLIAPSSTEGCSGSVLTAMAYGLIPIITKENGVDNDEAIWLENDNVDYIIEVVNSYSSKDIGWIIEKARKNQNIYYKNYTFNCFKDSFVEACKEIKI